MKEKRKEEKSRKNEMLFAYAIFGMCAHTIFATA